VAPQIVTDRSIDRNSVKNAGNESSYNQQCNSAEDYSQPRTAFALGLCVSIRIGPFGIVGEDQCHVTPELRFWHPYAPAHDKRFVAVASRPEDASPARLSFFQLSLTPLAER
jgi:hypothetical protein